MSSPSKPADLLEASCIDMGYKSSVASFDKIADNFVQLNTKKCAYFESKLSLKELKKELSIYVVDYENMVEHYGKQLFRINFWSEIVLIAVDNFYNFETQQFSSSANKQLIINVLNEKYDVSDDCNPTILYGAIAAYRELIREIRFLTAQICERLSTGEMQPQFAVDLICQISRSIADSQMLVDAVDADVIYSVLTELMCSEQLGVVEALASAGFTPEKTVLGFKNFMADCIWWSEKKIKNCEDCIARITKAHRL